MRASDLAELLLLAAIWGASFLFMRIATPEFGALTLAFLRVGGAALFLLPLLWLRQGEGGLLKRPLALIATPEFGALTLAFLRVGGAALFLLPLLWLRQGEGGLMKRPLALIACGFMNSALPFALYAFASLHIQAGLSSILNATTPMWGALVAWIWLDQRLTRWRFLGLVLGFAGVSWLALAKTGLSFNSSLWAVLGCLLATLNYAIGAVATKRWLKDVTPLAVAAGNQVGATLCLLPFGLWAWPAVMPSATAWFNLALLAIVCTGVAYILYFRFMARVGPTQAVTVTFLIPVFAVLWGAMFLGEKLTLPMLGGGALILSGTALALGLWPKPAVDAAGAPSPAAPAAPARPR